MLHVLYSVLASLQRPYLLLLLLPSLPSNRVFTIMYLKQTMVLGYIVGTVLSVQYLTRVILFDTCNIISHDAHSVLVQCPVWLFSSLP